MSLIDQIRPEDVVVELPTFHREQMRAWNHFGGAQFMVLRCGRRWGKTDYDKNFICDGILKGEPTGWFAPNYKYLTEAFSEIVNTLGPARHSSSRIQGVIHSINGGRCDFWSLENEDAGRSRKYTRVVIDEAAFAKNSLMNTWERAIQPTLLDYTGRALVSSNAKGIDEENMFYNICTQPKYGFKEFHAPSWTNPFVPKRKPGEPVEHWMRRRQEVFDKIRRENHPLVFQQEYKADFVDWSGAAFFERAKLLVGDDGVPDPIRCDIVFAVVDTAAKTGSQHDGTGVVYYAYNKNAQFPLLILDWDIKQISGDLLETWLPTIISNCEMLARKHGARSGSAGVFVEDKSTGIVLVQKFQRRGMPVHAIPSELTAIGKDERAISVSDHVYQGKVKFTRDAYNKVVTYKNISRNHLFTQVTGFRPADPDAAKRADDLLDCFTYGVAITLGNQKGL